jgi:hypothetical protein
MTPPPVMPPLEPRRELLRLDLPGHGRAPEPAALYGGDPEGAWDMGAVAEQLLLLCATPRFAQSDDWPHGTPAAVLGAFAGHLARGYRRTVREFLELQVRGSANAAATLAALQAALQAQGEFVQVARAGHAPFLSHAEQVVGLVRSRLATAPALASATTT